MDIFKLKENKKYTDKNLLKNFCDGKEDAYEHIYRLYFHQIYIFILRYVICKDLAYDLTQDIFVKIWEKRQQITQVENFQSYLYRVAKNQVLDELKHISVSKRALEQIASHYTRQSNLIDVKYVEKEYFEFLDAAIIDLPERTRTIFKLCREEKKSYKKIAEELGISKDTVKYHMVQSMKILKIKVVKYFNIICIMFF